MYLAIMLILMVASCGFACVSIDKTIQGDYRKAHLLKCIASVCFVGIGAITLKSCWYPKIGNFIFIGLSFGAVGDILLGFRYTNKEKKTLLYILGALSFAVGHICYVIALLSITEKAVFIAIPFAIIGMIIELKQTQKYKVKAGKLQIPGFFYMLLVTFMAGCALGTVIFNITPGTVLFAVAGMLFTVSDTIFVINNFGKRKSDRRSKMIYVTYYSAQILIAFSMMMLFIY